VVSVGWQENKGVHTGFVKGSRQSLYDKLTMKGVLGLPTKRQSNMSYENLIKQAEVHYNAYEHSQAIACATQAIETESTRVESYYWRGKTYRRIHAYEDMQKDANALLACTPSATIHFAYRGWAYNIKNVKDSKQAIDECSKALQQDASVKEAYHYRAWAYYDQGNYDLAIEDCDKAIELDPKYAAAYNNRGVAYKNKENFDRAIEDYNKAIELDPKYAAAYNNRGSAYDNKGDQDRAIEDYNKAIELDPKYAAAYNNRGIAYDNKGDQDRAIEDYNKAIELDPKYAAVYNNRGVAYKNKENFDRAIEDYNKAIELDPKYAAAYNNRENACQMKLVCIRNNREYMDMLKSGINKVVPFLGAGASIAYGYDSWKGLLLKLLDTCCRVQEEVSEEEREHIEKLIHSGCYVHAASEMDDIFANLSSTVCNAISRVASRNPISEANKRILGEYLHLFPPQIYLTTNYDQVIENLLKLQFENVDRVIATKASSESSSLRLTGSKQYRNPTVYYLHGIFTERNVILSDTHYDDHYGSEGDIKSSLRRDLPRKLRELHNDYTFLYVGCSMTIKEDRILKLLREFYRNLQNFPYSYAFLNIATVTGEEIPMTEWVSLSEEKRRQLETKLDEKEDELENMNVRIIWYYATTVSERELAQKTFFEYIFGERRKEWEREQVRRKQAYISYIEAKEKSEKQQMEWWQTIENIPCVEGVDTPDNQLQQVRNFLQSKIFIRAISSGKYAIAFPMYKVEGGLYQIYLISENGDFYLSDEGTTYAELDKIFELKEPDVIKNLVAILKQYGCRKHRDTNAFIIDCTLENIHIKMSHLIQALSFMLNMKIFYI
jgi:Flp pilus assembly protein TadD